MIIRLNKVNLVIWLYAFFVFLSMQPFFVWGNELVFLLIFSLIFILCLFFLKINVNINSKLFVIILFSLLFFIYLSIPFRKYDFGLSYRHILFFLSILILLFYLNNYIVEIWDSLRNIFALITLTVLISYLLYILSVPFPVINLNQSTRLKSTDTYYLYYGMIYLNTQNYNISGLNILRNIGWFGEPGHYGIYLAMILSMEKYPLQNKLNKILVLGILSTLSMAAYAFLIFIVVVRYFTFSKILVLIFMFFLGSIVVYLNYDFINQLFFSKLNDNVLESRGEFSSDFFIKSFYTDFFGLGKETLSINNVVSSDYRALWLRYGYLSFFIYFLSIIFLVSSIKRIDQLRTLIIFLGISISILLHRVWMIDTLYFWFYLFIVCIFISEKKGIKL